MSRRLLAIAALLLALPFAGGCSSAMPARASDAADMRQELQEVKQRLVEMERQARVQQLAIQELEAQVVALGGRPRSTAGSTAGATPVRPVPRTTPGTAAPSRPAAAVPREERLEPIPDRRRELEVDDVEVADVEVADVPVVTRQAPPRQVPPSQVPADPAVPRPTPSQQTTPDVPPAASTGPSTGPSTGQAAIPPAGQALYDRGYTLYHQGRYLDAEASFQRFLQAHGGTDLADNAQYWIGESRYARGDHRGALSAFRETVARFPQGNKVPDALLKAGQSLEQLGDTEGARETYRTLVERHAASAAAAVAEERLARLR